MGGAQFANDTALKIQMSIYCPMELCTSERSLSFYYFLPERTVNTHKSEGSPRVLLRSAVKTGSGQELAHPMAAPAPRVPKPGGDVASEQPGGPIVSRAGAVNLIASACQLGKLKQASPGTPPEGSGRSSGGRSSLCALFAPPACPPPALPARRRPQD